MTYEDTKIDQSFSRRRMTFQSKTDYQNFCRIVPDGIPATHKLDVRHIQPTAEQLAKNPHLLPTVEMQCVPLGIRDIAERTDDFKTLNVQQLRWMIETYGIVQEPEKDDKGNIVKIDEKTALASALRKHLKTNAEQIKKSDQPAPVVIAPEVAAMSEADLETKSAVMGVHDKYAASKKKGRPIAERRMIVSEAMAKKAEPVTA